MIYISSFLFFLIADTFFIIKKIPKIKTIFLIILIFILNSIAYYFMDSFMKLVSILAIWLIINNQIENEKLVSLSMIFSSISCILSLFISTLVKYFIHTKSSFLVVVIFAITNIVLIFLVRRNINRFLQNIYSNKFITLFSLNIFLLLIYIYQIKNINLQKNSISNIKDMMLSDFINLGILIIFSLPFIIICLLIYYNTDKNNLEEKENKLISTYYKDLDKTNQKLRKNQHDIKNIFLSLSGLIEKDDIYSLKKYFRENFKAYYDKILVDEDYISELSKINLSLLRGLIYEKISLAKSLNLDIFLRIPVRIEEVKIDELDLVKLLGILLDNAIEEVKTHSNSYIIIDILKTNKATTFAVENSITKEKVDVENLLSTKGENRGFGLLNLREIINSYDNIDFKTYSKDFKFVQIISIRWVHWFL